MSSSDISSVSNSPQPLLFSQKASVSRPYSPNLSLAQQQAIINLLNNYRTSLQQGKISGCPQSSNLTKLKWDTNLYKKLIGMTKQPGFNPEACVNNPHLPSSQCNYLAIFEELAPQDGKSSYWVIATDGMSQLPTDVYDSIKMRINREIGCLNIPNCNKYPGNYGYFQCINNPSSQACAWAQNYITQFVAGAKYLTFACIRLASAGVDRPTGEGYQYFCAGQGLNDGYSENINTTPYSMGPACSACPPEAPYCFNQLCSSDEPAIQASRIKP